MGEGEIIGAFIAIIVALYIIAIMIAILIVIIMIALYGGSVFYLSKHLYKQTKEKYHLTNKSLLALVGVGIGSFVLSTLILPDFWPIPVAILLFLVLAIPLLWAWGLYKLKKTLNPLRIDEIVLEKKTCEINNEIKNIDDIVKQYQTDISSIKTEKGNQVEEITQLNLKIRNICGGDRWLATRKDELIRNYGKYDEKKLEELHRFYCKDKSDLEYLILRLKLLESNIGDDYKIITDKNIKIDSLISKRTHLENILNKVKDKRIEVGNTIANSKIERIVLD